MAERQPTDSRQVQIADAALQVIAEEGLGGFTTAAIGKLVGLTSGSLFRHFPSKQAIVRAAIARADELLFAAFPPQGGNPLDRLGAFFRQRVRLVAKNPGIARVVFSEQLAQAAGDKGRTAVGAIKQRSLEFIRECVTQAADEGLLVEGLDVEAVVTLVSGAALAIVFTEAPTGRELPGEERAERVWSTLQALLGKRVDLASRPRGEPRGRERRAAR